jgi:hypothetical protein
MIRLTTALLTLGAGMAIATTAIAMEPQGWCNCNPEAPACRVYCGSEPEWSRGYVAPAHPRSMYMYVPRHSTHTHKNAPR